MKTLGRRDWENEVQLYIRINLLRNPFYKVFITDCVSKGTKRLKNIIFKSRNGNDRVSFINRRNGTAQSQR